MDITTATLDQYLEIGAQIRAGRVDRNTLQRFIEAPDRYREDVGRFGRMWPVTIDGNLNAGKLIDLGKYGWKNPDATAEHFPYVRKGQTNVTLELYEFDDTVTGSEAEQKIDADGYQLEESDALLTFGIKYPIEQRRRPVVCIGKNSRWQHRDGLVCVLCLGLDHSGRDLNLYRFEEQFNPRCQFLVSRK